MTDFAILGAASSGMQAQRAAMDIAARNVALAQTGDARHPAHGLVPDFATVLSASSAPEGPEDADVTALEAQLSDSGDDANAGAVVAISGAHVGSAPLDSITEMINVLDSQRAYEANASIFDIGKRLSERTIDMGRL
ncbi:MAG: flagellar basal body rod C-terminal domain-containing protein [Candidatus Velthaea sp.]|jgi:flagellar basal body rod protein FlgC